MTSLDLRTIIQMSTITGATMGIVLFSAYRSFPSSVKGLGFWALGTLMIGVAATFYGLRDVLPVSLSVICTNSAMYWGVGFWFIGTSQFYDLLPRWWIFHLVWALGMIAAVWWTLVSPSYAARLSAFSILIFVFYFLQARLIARHGERHFSTYFFGLLMSIQAATVLVRGLAALSLHGSDAGTFEPTKVDTIYLATLSFMMMLLPVGFMTVATRRLQILLEQRSNLDPLTGVLNRRGFAGNYVCEKARMKRNGQPLTLMSIDLDFFKSINDRFGHGVGDRVLIHAADKISKVLRTTDHMARFGGEEFVVLLSETTIERSLLVAARIQASLKEVDDQDLPTYTVSIGIASQYSPDEILEEVLSRADAALYRAKAGGRNRVEVAELADQLEARVAA